MPCEVPGQDLIANLTTCVAADGLKILLAMSEAPSKANLPAIHLCCLPLGQVQHLEAPLQLSKGHGVSQHSMPEVALSLQGQLVRLNTCSVIPLVLNVAQEIQTITVCLEPFGELLADIDEVAVHYAWVILGGNLQLSTGGLSIIMAFQEEVGIHGEDEGVVGEPGHATLHRHNGHRGKLNVRIINDQCWYFILTTCKRPGQRTEQASRGASPPAHDCSCKACSALCIPYLEERLVGCRRSTLNFCSKHPCTVSLQPGSSLAIVYISFQNVN